METSQSCASLSAFAKPTYEESTAVTAKPFFARYTALRPSPSAKHNTRPTFSYSALSKRTSLGLVPYTYSSTEYSSSHMGDPSSQNKSNDWRSADQTREGLVRWNDHVRHVSRFKLELPHRLYWPRRDHCHAYRCHRPIWTSPRI